MRSSLMLLSRTFVFDQGSLSVQESVSPILQDAETMWNFRKNTKQGEQTSVDRRPPATTGRPVNAPPEKKPASDCEKQSQPSPGPPCPQQDGNDGNKRHQSTPYEAAVNIPHLVAVFCVPMQGSSFRVRVARPFGTLKPLSKTGHCGIVLSHVDIKTHDTPVIQSQSQAQIRFLTRNQHGIVAADAL
jgi:hypothetical protein